MQLPLPAPEWSVPELKKYSVNTQGETDRQRGGRGTGRQVSERHGRGRQGKTGERETGGDRDKGEGDRGDRGDGGGDRVEG